MTIEQSERTVDFIIIGGKKIAIQVSNIEVISVKKVEEENHAVSISLVSGNWFMGETKTLEEATAEWNSILNAFTFVKTSSAVPKATDNTS